VARIETAGGHSVHGSKVARRGGTLVIIL